MKFNWKHLRFEGEMHSLSVDTRQMHDFRFSITDWFDEITRCKYNTSHAAQKQMSIRMCHRCFNDNTCTTWQISSPWSINIHRNSWINHSNYIARIKITLPQYTVVGDDMAARGILKDLTVFIELLNDATLHEIWIPLTSFFENKMQNLHRCCFNFGCASPEP